MTLNQFSQEIYNRYGIIKRARNCFLYTQKNIRLTDCFQENGRAILGWEGGSAFTQFKNVLSRGQVGSFITEDAPRINKAVSSLLASDRKVYFFSTKIEALKAGLFLSNENTSFYKPWTRIDWSKIDSVIIQPPLPWTNTIFLLAIKSELIQETEKNIFQNQINIPFALNVAITRAIYNLIAELQTREEKNWFIYDTILTKYFEREGPYLKPKIDEKKYDDFVLHCLDLGIVINPNYNEDSIIPFGADKGVFTCLKNSPFLY